MGSVNSIPIVSQIKSFVQWIFGDSDGAKKTQEDFVQECPIVSQVTKMIKLNKIGIFIDRFLFMFQR